MMHVKLSERKKSLLKLIARILIPIFTGTIFSLLVPVETRCSENLHSLGANNVKLFKVREGIIETKLDFFLVTPVFEQTVKKYATWNIPYLCETELHEKLRSCKKSLNPL